MGITINSKRCSCDMGYGGFKRFRDIVSSLVGEDFHKHYIAMDTPGVAMLSEKESKEYFKIYNAKIKELIDESKITYEVAHFLYESDCEGKIDRKQAKQIYELIKNENDDISFGYWGRSDCAKMSDMKKMFNDKTKIEWR